jgi:hypothetical protein
MDNINYNQDNNSNRWLGYFDLLGTAELIRSGRSIQVFSAYQIAYEKLDGWKKRHENVLHSWFSDTFILYTEDDSAESFAAIEIVCRWFMFSLLREKVPVRGAMSCGSFYADPTNGIYLGDALLDAYELGENQDWLGFVLTPSTTARLEELNLPIKERLNYSYYNIPFKKPRKTNSHAACILGNWIRFSDGRNPLVSKLQEMLSGQSDERIRRKYERTIAFLHEKQEVW